MTKALTLHQPWASLVALGVKTIETRSWPTRYRGRLLIHAGAKRPTFTTVGAWICDPRYRLGGQYGPREPRIWRSLTQPGDLFGTHESRELPLGAIVASCTLVDVVDVVGADGCKNATKHLCIINQSMLLHSVLDEPWPDGQTEHIVSDQMPYGDFAPGRFAWLLEDVKPTTERCPSCWGTGDHEEGYDPIDDTTDLRMECTRCDGAGWCDPVPAKGHQQLWEWAA